MAGKWSDRELLAGAQRGDASMLDELLTRYEKSIYRFGLRMCGSEDAARDVLQETLLAAFKALPEFRGDAKLSTWLFQIARSFCVKARRRHVGEPAALDSLEAVKAWVAERSPRHAVVVGAGFIGLETAEALKNRGLDVTVVELLPQVLPPLDADAADLVARHLEGRGVRLVLSDGIAGLSGGDPATAVQLASGRELPADLVILSIGVRNGGMLSCPSTSR